MFGIENYWGFIAAGVLLNLTPGTDSMYIIMRSISQGREAGLYSALGITSGILVHTVLAALGLSVLLSSYPVAFTVVKYIGALYLCYLGIKMIVDNKSALVSEALEENEDKVSTAGHDDVHKAAANNGVSNNGISNKHALSHWQIYKQGVFTNVFNPKIALFFLAFFPQFIDASYANGVLSFLILGLTFATTSLLWCASLALLAAMFSAQLREKPAIEMMLNKVSGIVFIGLGIKLMTAKP